MAQAEHGKSSASKESAHTEEALQALRADFEELRQSVMPILERLKARGEEVVENVQGETGQLSHRLRELFDGLGERGSGTATNLEHHVRDQPLRSVAVAVGVGFVLSRLLGGGRR